MLRAAATALTALVLAHNLIFVAGGLTDRLRSTLLLDGRLTDILRRLPKGTNAETLLDAMLRSTVGRPCA